MTCLKGFLVFLLLAGASANASLISPGVTSCPNGSITFTSVGFGSTWNTCGNASGAGSTATIDSTDISKDAGVTTLQSFLGLPAGTLSSAFLKISPAPGSAIGQSFATTTGGRIDFDYTFTAEAGSPASSFFAMNGAAFPLAVQQVFLDAPIRSAPPVTPVHASLPAPAGNYIVGFGIVGQRLSLDPTLSITNLVFTPAAGPSPVPEPASLLFTVTGLLGGLAVRRRRSIR